MKNKSIFFVIIIIGILLIMIPTKNFAASSNLLPTSSNNIEASLKRYSSIVSLSSGYMRVFYDNLNKNIGVEYYDNDFNILEKKKIELELNIYGGFYAGSNAYYIVEGQNNVEEDNNKEVIRIIKYNTNWEKVGSAKITSDSTDSYKEIRYPFNTGCVEMTEIDGKLYIVTGHEGYVDSSIGQGHQGFLMIEVDETSLTGRIVNANLWHSFAQYIDHDDQNLYVLEQSEGSGRTQLTKYNKNNITEKTTISLLNYGGDRSGVWATACYASVDGVALSENNILSIGTSIDQSQYSSVTSKTAHNIYLAITPKNNFSNSNSTNLKWLTNYTGDGKSFSGLEITKINDNKFMISWEEYGERNEIADNDTLSIYKLHYIFIDENGNKIGNEYTKNASISKCKPVVKDDTVVYYASNGNMVDFYKINTTNGELNKKMYRVAGENAEWSFKDDGTLLIEGSGSISADAETIRKLPVSSTSGMFSYSMSDNCWAPIRDQVKKIEIGEGIVSIKDSEFKYFSEITEVIMPKTMTTIGNQAFEYCESVLVFMPKNVTNIGEDAFWSGWYTTSGGNKISYATIYTEPNSYVSNWAKTNNIKTKLLGDINEDGLITASDARLALLYYVGGAQLSDGQKLSADVTYDKKITASDARKILLYYVGQITSFD